MPEAKVDLPAVQQETTDLPAEPVGPGRSDDRTTGQISADTGLFRFIGDTPGEWLQTDTTVNLSDWQ